MNVGSNTKKLLQHLVHPKTKKPLDLVNEYLTNGVDKFHVVKDISRFVNIENHVQSQIAKSFSYKWKKTLWGHDEKSKRVYLDWIKKSFGFEDDNDFFAIFNGCKRILDAGCGVGVLSSWIAPNLPHVLYFNVDISDSAEIAFRQNKKYDNVLHVQADLNQLPFKYEYFDAVISLGVLHHTPNTFMSLKNLIRYLKIGGLIIIYVYKKKSPIREFTDDYVREKINEMCFDDAWKEMEKITLLGKYLSELNITLNIPVNIDILGIKKGKIDIQRFFYWNILKCFWNPELSFEQNVLINFDWFHPKFAHRHTEEEIRSWFKILNLEILKFADVESGFYVMGMKKEGYEYEKNEN